MELHIICFTGYDRTGEGLHLDRSFFDKYGAPVELENFWMEGYHAMDRLLAQHMLAINNREIPFPPVAGYAGTTHLYKVKLLKILTLVQQNLANDGLASDVFR